MDFAQLALFLSVAAVAGTVVKVLKQPLIIGYLLAGVVLAASGVITESHSLESLAQIGVTLLLFLLGLEMNIKELSSVGKVAIITGVGQILFTSVIGFLLVSLMGASLLPAIYIGIALTFSSTIIVVKLLSEKKDLSSLYGKISIGILLVQDFVAILFLMFLGGVGDGSASLAQYLVLGIRGAGFFAIVWFLSKKILPVIFEKVVDSSSELLFIVSIAWALGVASFVAGPLGFTLEIGGFLAGIALSNLPEHIQIASRTRPLRDFFLVIFFLLLGTQLIIGGEILTILPQAVVLIIFVLVGIPIIVLIIMGYLGYKKRTSLLTGLTLAQISEFSFIFMAMGRSLGHVSDTDVSLIVIVGVATMTISTYMILEADKLFNLVHKKLSVFEKKKTIEDSFIIETKHTNHVVLVGSDRTGTALSKYFMKNKLDFVVVDFNPTVYSRLSADNIAVIFGDINDPEVASAANLIEARTIISTANSLNANITLLYRLKQYDLDQKTTIFTAASVPEAVALYQAGATYVVVPEIVAGEHLRHMLNTYNTSHSKYSVMGKRHFKKLLNKG